MSSFMLRVVEGYYSVSIALEVQKRLHHQVTKAQRVDFVFSW